MEFIIHLPEMFFSLLESISPNKKGYCAVGFETLFYTCMQHEFITKMVHWMIKLHYLKKKHVYLTQKKPRWIIWKLKGTQRRSVETIIKSLIENAHTKPIY